MFVHRRFEPVIEALAAAMTSEAVAEVVVRQAATVVHGSSSVLLLLDGGRTTLALAGATALDDEKLARWRRQPLADNAPVLDVVRDEQPIFIETHAAWVERYPEMARLAVIPPGARALAPVRVYGRLEGVLCVGFVGDHVFSDDDRANFDALARHCGLALERCRAFADAAAARARTETLQRLSTSLARAVDIAGTCAALVDAVGVAFSSAASYVVWDDGVVFRLAVTDGMDRRNLESWATFSRERDSPTRDALRDNALLFFEDADAYVAAYPWMESMIRREGNEAAAIVPIVVDGRPFAVLGLRFAERRVLDDETRELLLAVAAQGGVAFERARLVEGERKARARTDFLAHAGRVLASSLDLEVTLQHIAALPVPDLADWCAVELLGADGAPECRALCHRDAATGAALLERRRRHPPDRAVVDARAALLDDGRARRLSDVDAARLLPGYGDAVGAGAVVVALGAVDGCLVFGGGSHGVADVALADDLAARAAVAVANARTHAEMQRARAEAEGASRAKDEFLALLGHELRNPLMPITTAIELLKLDDVDDATRTHALSIIQRQSGHLVRLVDDLLDVSRIARGMVTLSRRPRRVGDVVRRAIEMASPIIETQRHELRTQLAADVFVDADEDRLVQVFVNLLTNAARYTPRGGHIDVACVVVDDVVEVSVADDGQGLTADLLPRMFDLFVQGPRGIDRAAGGLGLGLSVVKSITELHGGSVAGASPGPGRGSTFTVRLPVCPAPAEAAPIASASSAVTSLRFRRVAVVDDNADLADSLGHVLRGFGADVAVFHDPVRALGELIALAPEVAILDIGLPVIDGYELCRRLVPSLPGTVFVALTGYGQTEDKQRALAAGFHLHLVKPIDTAQLLTALNDVTVARSAASA